MATFSSSIILPGVPLSSLKCRPITACAVTPRLCSVFALTQFLPGLHNMLANLRVSATGDESERWSPAQRSSGACTSQLEGGRQQSQRAKGPDATKGRWLASSRGVVPGAEPAASSRETSQLTCTSPTRCHRATGDAATAPGKAERQRGSMPQTPTLFPSILNAGRMAATWVLQGSSGEGGAWLFSQSWIKIP